MVMSPLIVSPKGKRDNRAEASSEYLQFCAVVFTVTGCVCKTEKFGHLSQIPRKRFFVDATVRAIDVRIRRIQRVVEIFQHSFLSARKTL